MATPAQYYVDPSLGVDTGNGLSPATAWGRASESVVQYALNSISGDTSNGDQINIKAGVDDTLTGALDFTNYGTPTEVAPLIFRGYSITGNDGGIGGIDGDGSGSIYVGGDDVAFIDLHLHNCGANNIIEFNSTANSLVVNCEVNNTTATAIVCGVATLVSHCNIHDFGLYGIDLNGNSSMATNNYISVTGGATTAIRNNNSFTYIDRNIISIGGAVHGIYIFSGDQTTITHNSILSASGTGKGILKNNERYGMLILNNLIEGFAGAGGVGMQFDVALNEKWKMFGHNAVYNCETAYDVQQDFLNDLGDNETLSGSPFAKNGSDTFANRAAYFQPVDTGNVIGGAY